MSGFAGRASVNRSPISKSPACLQLVDVAGFTADVVQLRIELRIRERVS